MGKLILPKYTQAVREIVRIAEEARRSQVEAYWSIGKRIVQVEQDGAVRARYGAGLLEALSDDLTKRLGLGFSVSNLKRMRAFYLANPIRSAPSELGWTQHVELLSVRDQKKRLLLEHKALREGLDSRKLRQLVRAERLRENRSDEQAISPESAQKAAASYKPKRGKVGFCRIKNGKLDLGFSCFKNLTREMKDGTIVHVTEGGQIREDKEASAGDIYTYAAEVEKVVDGDTIWVWVNLGFDFSVRQKLRFRGINAPEMDTEAGKRAKKFVEEALKPFEESGIEITTTKPDKYDRYLADIWLGDVNLNKLLLEKGLARLQSDTPETVWDDTNSGRF